MKQSNGFVPETMAEEVDTVPIENHAEVNAAAPTIGSMETPEVFNLAPIKPKGMPKFKIMAMYKSRLKGCIMVHFLLFLVMSARLSEDFLDRFEIFILQIEELFIPPAFLFDYIYFSSILFAIMGLRALSKNLGSLKTYAAGTIVFCIGPLLFAAGYFFYDVLEYSQLKEEADILRWKGFPVACYYYIYILIALQVHMFSVYFAAKLLKFSNTKMKKI